MRIDVARQIHYWSTASAEPGESRFDLLYMRSGSVVFEHYGRNFTLGPNECALIDSSSAYYFETSERSECTSLPLGTSLPKTPSVKFNISPQYQVMLPHESSLRFLLDWTHTSSVYNDAYNTSELKRPTVNMIGASVQYATRDDKVTLIVGGTNLKGERYITTGQNQQGGGFIYETYSEPREWYVTGRVKF